MEVTIIKPGPSKAMLGSLPVYYSEEAVKNSLSLWEGAACFCDHFNKSVRNIAGVYFAPWYEGGVKARLRFTDPSLYFMVCQVMQDREKGLPVPDIGISADIIVRGNSLEDSIEVTEISQVISADIVFAPAAGGSFDRVLNSAMQQLGITEGQNDTPSSLETPPGGLISGHSVENFSPGENRERNPGGEGQGIVPENAEKRIRDLQSAADKLRNTVQNQKAVIASQSEAISQLQSDIDEAVSRYRERILRDHPEIPAEMVNGSTVEEVDESLEKARSVVDAIKQHLDEQVPLGAPARSGVDVEALSSRQKIEYGVKRGLAKR